MHAEEESSEENQRDKKDENPAEVPLGIIHRLVIVFLDSICEAIKHWKPPVQARKKRAANLVILIVDPNGNGGVYLSTLWRQRPDRTKTLDCLELSGLTSFRDPAYIC